MPKDSESLLHSLIRAENGERDGVCEILWYFCETVEDGRKPDRAVIEFVANIFRKILDGEKADKAFGFTRGQGNPGSNTLERDFLLALEVAHKKDQDSTIEAAIAEISESQPFSDGTVRAAWLKYKNYIDGEDVAAFAQLQKGQVKKT